MTKREPQRSALACRHKPRATLAKTCGRFRRVASCKGRRGNHIIRPCCIILQERTCREANASLKVIVGNPEVCLCDLLVATLACITPSHHPERQAFPGSDQLREPPALVFPLTTPTVRLPPVSGCKTQAGCGSTAVSHKTNTWIDGNGQGSSLWRCVGTLQTCFFHDHSAATRPNQTDPRPPASATVQCRVDQPAG